MSCPSCPSSSPSSSPPMSASESNSNTADTGNPEVTTNTSNTTNPPASSKTPRVRPVHIRSLVDFADPRELAQVMLDAVTAHKHLYEDAGILHGDINPNTIAIFAFPDGDGARSVGGLIDCDEPLRTVKV